MIQMDYFIIVMNVKKKLDRHGIRYDNDNIIFNLLSNEDRAFSIALNATYHFGEF